MALLLAGAPNAAAAKRPEKPIWHPPGQFQTIDDAQYGKIKLWYETMGDPAKPPLVFVSGGPGATHTYLHEGAQRQLEKLSEDFFLIFYDTFGTGRSTRKTGVFAPGVAYNERRDTDHFYKLLDALARKYAWKEGVKVNVATHSAGGWIGLTAATSPRPTEKKVRIGKLVLMSTADVDNADIEANSKNLYRWVDANYPEVYREMRRLDKAGVPGDDPRVSALWDKVDLSRGTNLDPAKIRRYNRATKGIDASNGDKWNGYTGYFMDSHSTYDVRANLGRLKELDGILLVTARNDLFAPAKIQERNLKLFPKTTQEIFIDNSAHCVLQGNPNKVTKAIAQFLKGGSTKGVRFR